ncbi:MAG: MFS transporter [Phycisphaerae bacterium]|jgi:MFS family permease
MHQLFKDKNFLRLCLAAFFMSSCLQLVQIVMPFVAKSLGGSDTEVGLCFMGQMGVYVIFCIMAYFIVEKFKPRRVLWVSAAGQAVIVCGILGVIWLGKDTPLAVTPVMQLVFLMSMIGIVTAFYWPVLMGWISTGHEGAELTKRLGFYNVTWGSANMLLPIVGGYLMEINYILPVTAAVIVTILCIMAVSTTTCISEIPIKKSEDLPVFINDINQNEKSQFLWISRVAMFANFICAGIFRSQLGIYYKFELGFTESVYGWAISLMCLFNVVVFYMMGRSYWWHYKKGMFVASQFLIVICMMTIIFSHNIVVQLLAAGMTGITYGITYSSHQYYGVSGGKNRAGRMAIHEIILGTGFAAGSLLGGMISDSFGRHFPYWFGCGIMAAFGIFQVILWFSIGILQKQKRLS